MTYQPTLRDRLIARNGLGEEALAPLHIPVTGRIDSVTVSRVHELALQAAAGDRAARDHLWIALQPRLDRKGWVLKPWPNSPGFTGLWDRDDVRQESWIVFAELLSSWDGKINFIPYLLARFSWRLRDRILRGIGKRQSQFGSIRVPEALIDELLVASDAEQPESVAIARRLLEELLHRHMSGVTPVGEFEAWLELITTPGEAPLVSPALNVPPANGRKLKRSA